jgi:A/G-specific adenine glycosylase
VPAFASTLVAWQRRHGRHDLPWQGTRDPYRIWLSEVMLQQTQVAAVVPYYERFLRKFPTVDDLARAEEEEVLQLWSGLGYYARGRNLHAAARQIARTGFPKVAKDIEALPGVGRSTAAAIAVFAFGERAAILDGNAKRVLARCFAVEEEKELWKVSQQLVPHRDVRAYTQALMDLGATLCTRRPDCARCPVSRRCIARREGRVAELPTPRAKKTLPLRHTTWLILKNENQVLLERRPSPGIWGGLWCFPESLNGAPRGRKLAPIEHGFTHFRLRIQPLLRDVRARKAAGPARRWMRIADLASAAVPTPVRRLIDLLR